MVDEEPPADIYEECLTRTATNARADPADIHAAVWTVGCRADVLPGGDIHEQQDENPADP